ncbi:MAG TPA: hypothetical protein VJG85_00345 [Patescibacteria group bacterium]|nr:hypothetical protein [Patescibacteria group bacterium]
MYEKSLTLDFDPKTGSDPFELNLLLEDGCDATLIQGQGDTRDLYIYRSTGPEKVARISPDTNCPNQVLVEACGKHTTLVWKGLAIPPNQNRPLRNQDTLKIISRSNGVVLTVS